jgi:predicted Zn-dependent peptidase
LRGLSAGEAERIADRYLDLVASTAITLKASPGKKRGTKVSLQVPVHDLGRRRAAPDPALAQRPAAEPTHDTPGVRTRVLANGLKVVLVPTTTVPTVEARLVFGTGTGDEPATQRGIAMFAADTLTWDLHDLPDIYQFVRVGGLRDTDVGTDRTSFTVNGLDSTIDLVLTGLRRWVRDGVYDDSASSFVNAMRAASKHSDDQGPLTDAWRAALFGAAHPYVEAGIVRHVNSALTLTDAAQFRSRHYTPDNATLVITGRFDARLADRWIDFLFADWQGHADPRSSGSVRSQPASIGKVDDLTLVQVRLALPATTGRAAELVAAAMLNDIVHDVRYRLGASYTLEAELAETRLASFYVIGGWVDATRAASALELVRDRIRELHSDATAAARAFVIARRHVLGQLHARIASAGALATRIERDVEMGRAPMSDIGTAADVKAMTLANMTTTLEELDLARATVLLDGPGTEVKNAFEVLGRKPVYVDKVPAADTVASPGTAGAFAAAEQHVRLADVAPSLTEQPPPRVMVTLVPGASVALGSGLSTLTGYSVAATIGYRHAWQNAIGVSIELAHLSGQYAESSTGSQAATMIPIDVLGVLHFEGAGRTWTDLLLGLHTDRLTDATTRWREGWEYGVQIGADVVRLGSHRLGFAARYLRTSGLSYSTLSIGLQYRL